MTQLFEETKEGQQKLFGLLNEKYDGRLPFVKVSGGCFGYDSVFLLVSFDKKEDWVNGYVENSNYFQMAIYSNGSMKVFTQSLYEKGHRNSYNHRLSNKGIKFRTSKNVSTVEKMFEKIDAFISKIEEEYK